MAKIHNERDFQNFIKDTVKSEGSWYSQLHPGMGSDVGVPDLLLAVDSVGILPSELKIGSIDKDNRTIWSRAIRPAQIAWHTRLTGHGYLSCVLIGVHEGGRWRIFVVDGMSSSKCKDGFTIDKDAKEIDPRFFTAEIDQWAEDSSKIYSED